MTDVIQLTLSLKMTTAQVVEMSVTVNNNSPLQDHVHLEDPTQLLMFRLVIILFILITFPLNDLNDALLLLREN